jgi:CubicO group peptidase (beta-lactamase class C family)
MGLLIVLFSICLLNKQIQSKMKPMKKIVILSITVLFFISCKNTPEPALTLSSGEVSNEVHKNNIGKIAFMSDWIPLEKFSENHFINELSISNTSDFGFRMFLGKTLTYYLSELEPDLSVRELCGKGNFQLTFFVDNKEIYKKNLQTGAGSCEYKNSATAYGIPLVNKNISDHWGVFLWLKFMKKEGGQKALSNGSHDLRIEVRPYIEHKQFKVGDIIAQGEVKLTFVEKEVEESKIAIQPIQSTDKWEVSETNYDTFLIRQLNQKIAQNYFQDITSIVVVKEGKLLIEEYFNGANRNTLHDTRSVGKTLASTIMGIAIEEGHLENENQTLKDFYNLKSYKNYSSQKGNVTLKSLLTMSSSFDGSDMDPDSPGNEENMYPTSDWVKFGLDLSMDSNKTIGNEWDYFTAGAVILGDVLNKTVPEGLEKYADKKLFKPLGISNYKWQFTTSNVPNTAGGFQMSSLDNARYGQLYLDNGMYNGKQILSEKWVESSLTKQIALLKMENEFYGYLLWNKKYNVNNQEIEAYYASGNGGNKILIFKDLDALVVVTATAYNQTYMHYQVDEIIKNYILPILMEK